MGNGKPRFKPVKPPDSGSATEDELRRFGEALMQVSKEELAEVVAAEERDKAELPHEKRRGRPKRR